MLISLLHATRNRPEQALRCRSLWLAKATQAEQIEHLFAFDDDDAASQTLLRHQRHVLVSPGGSSVAAWNTAAEKSKGRVLIQLSDDWEPPSCWDRLILEHLGNLSEPRVLAVSDGHRKDRLLCMAILTRARYEEQGWMFYPGYQSVWSDNEFTHRAYADGIVIEARHLVFRHRHPMFAPSIPMDGTYIHQNRKEAYTTGQALFLERNPGAEKTQAPVLPKSHDPRLSFLKARIQAAKASRGAST